MKTVAITALLASASALNVQKLVDKALAQAEASKHVKPLSLRSAEKREVLVEANRMILQGDYGDAVTYEMFSSTDCTGDAFVIQAYPSGYVMQAGLGYMYYECRDDGIYQANGLAKDWDPTKDAGYDKNTMDFTIDVNNPLALDWTKTKCTAGVGSGSSRWTCGDKDVNHKGYLLSPAVYATADCAAEGFVGSATFFYAACVEMDGYDYNTCKDKCYVPKGDCEEEKECPVEEEEEATSAPYDAKTSCFTEKDTAKYESGKSMCANVLANPGCQEMMGASVYVSQTCGKYVPGSPNVNAAGVAAPVALLVAGFASLIALF